MIALAEKRQPAGSFTRRGACPALSAPMQTGDGLLVRLNPVAGGLTPAQLAGLCEAAHACGNGVVEVTARGSVQVRGLTGTSAVPFAKAVDRLGIAIRTGVSVQTGILAGLDPDEIAGTAGLAESIRAGIATTGLEPRLGPKVSVVIDGGGRTALDAIAADVRLTAVFGSGRSIWQAAIAGDARTASPLGTVAGDEAACEAVLSVLVEVAALGREARARDLSEGQLPSILKRLRAAEPPTSGGPNVAGSLVGTVRLRDDRVALGVALPFGHTTANRLKTFAESAESLGIDDIRPAPGRTLVAICGTAFQAEALRNEALALGLVTSPDDPRLAISACPGAPDCASGHIPARKIAAEIAREYSGLFDGSLHLHVSGCAKGCAHPGKAELTVIGSEAGTGLVLQGTARDRPLAFAAGDGGRRGLAGIAALVSAERYEAETTAQTIQRLGLSALAGAFEQGEK